MKMRSSTEHGRRLRVVRDTIWAWDLWTALVLGILFGFVWYTFAEFRATWAILVPVATASLGIAFMAWNRRESLRTKLSTSTYGEVLRITDEDEEKASLPYTVVIYVGILSGAWSAGVAIAIGGVENRVMESVLLGFAMFWFTWAFLGVASLVHYSRVHDRNAARLDAARERLGAERRLRSTDGQPNS